MSKKFYISDLHFNHDNIIRFDNRPFKDGEEMKQVLIQRWNDAVEPGDVVYVLGDMFWKTHDAAEILDALNGEKFLIRGNHDRFLKDKRLTSKFVKVTEYLEVEDDGRKIVLCHYPIPCYKNHYYGWYHLYGHVHTGFEWNIMESVKRDMETLYNVPCEMYNVGCMLPYMNYTPRTLDEILAANKPHN